MIQKRRQPDRPGKHGRSPFAVAPLLLLALLLVGCGPDEPSRPNVVFVLIDTLRADHLPSYGYTANTAPRLQELAQDSVVFERVIAPSSWTKTSMASILTARDPHRHGVRRPNDVLPAALTTLAEGFRDAGYQTLAVNTNPWLKTNFGFAEGYDDYRQLDLVDRKFPTCWDVNRVGQELIEKRDVDRPFFLSLHYMDVHAPYRPSPRFFAGAPLELPGIGRIPDPDLEYGYRKKGLDGPGVAERIRALYDAGIRETDAAIGQFLDALFQAVERENTILVITSDHGEEFREHGRTEHGSQLYPEVLDVPLLVYAPGRASAGRVADQVRSIDVAPTCFALAGLAVPDTFEGEPLLGPGSTPGDRLAVCAVGLNDSAPRQDYFGVVTREYFFVKERRGGAMEMYEIADDPGATRDLGGEHPKAQLFEKLADAAASPVNEQAELDAATLEALKEFGYFDR